MVSTDGKPPAPGKVAELPLTGEARLRAKRAQRKQSRLSPSARTRLEGLGATATGGAFGLPRAVYFAAALGWGVHLLYRGGGDRDWMVTAVLVALGIL